MLNKQAINITFDRGVDKKRDPFQISVGNFLQLSNSIFDTLGRLTKRNGFGYLPFSSPSSFASPATFLTTFNGNLTAINNAVQAYSADTQTFVPKGSITPLSLSTLPLIRSNLNQTQADAAVAPNGLVCTVYTQTGGTPTYAYAIADSVTGQNIISPTAIPAASGGTITGSPRVFVFVNYFIIVFTNNISGSFHLQYISIPFSNPTIVSASIDIAVGYTPKTTLSWDGLVVGTKLFFAYNTTAISQRINVTYISSNLGAPVTPKSYVGQIATMMTLAVDVSPSVPVVYVSYYDLASTTGFALGVDTNLNSVMTPTEWVSSGTLLNLISIANNGVLTIGYETSNTVSALGSAVYNFISSITVTKPATVTTGVVGSATVFLRSVGLASKAITYGNVIYFLVVQASALQNTYFLVNGSAQVVCRFAYQNGGGYDTKGLPNISINSGILQVPYLYADLITTVNKNTNVAVGTQTAQIYTQTGINLASFNFNPKQTSAEIGNNLNLSGGVIMAYDGYSLTEQNMFLYPENVTVTSANTGGLITAQQYFYQAVYEWGDNQGNIFRSSPSVPVTVTTSGSVSANTITVPTLRLTYKTANPVKITLYRWSAGQQIYYQVTSLTSPTLNDPTIDYVTITDTFADSAILGNNIIYTNGGVLEDVCPPASDVLNLFNNRVWMIDAEDRNLLWYSKQVIEATPVEMSDLLTLYVAPTTGVQGSTGPMYCLASMDDKQIIFKANAAYYINGIGPDNTGSNSQYSDPIYITSSVGCTNPQSIALIPNGLMFQSNKGIWLLGRDLSTNYIGAAVEGYTTGAIVTSVVSVPGTNQVRFSLSTGISLMYDYYVGQWATFSNPQISSVIYDGLHTYTNSLGQFFQETPGAYLDGTSPVLMSLQTGWLSLAGIQGFERFYYSLLLGTYITPFKLNVQYSFDYNNGPSNNVIVSPSNYTPAWGGDALWGSNQVWGGPGNAFKARIFPTQQKCETFQVTINEIYDPSFGIQAGAGLTLSGLSLVAGVKRGFRTQKAGNSFG